jgi:hypothetical protein
MGHVVVKWLRNCATNRKVAGSILEFFIYIILPAALGPGVCSASNRNEYQEYFLVIKAADNLTTFICRLS